MFFCIMSGMFGVILTVLFLARKEPVHAQGKGIAVTFEKAGHFLYRKLVSQKRTGRPSPQTERIGRILERLTPGAKRDQAIEGYMTGKLSHSLMLLAAGCGLSILLYLGSRGTAVTDPGIERPKAWERSGEVLLEATVEGSSSRPQILVELGARQWTKEEAEEALEAFLGELSALLPGENPGLSEIRESLVLSEELEGYPFTVSWSCDRIDLLDLTDGSVTRVREAEDLRLTALISYGEWEWEEDFSLRVLPPILTDEEALLWDLEELIRAGEEETRTSDSWNPPGESEGRSIAWKVVSEDRSGILFGMTTLVAILIFFFSDRDLEKKLKERQDGMKEEYPTVLRKMALYLGAGMTVRGAFEKTALEGDPKREIYEEMLFACHGMKTGIPEGEAYERFGRRCGVQEYIRFSALLNQNLRKGSNDLLVRLREETGNANREQLLRFRKEAEEAVTKLLLPMVLMLLVVMAMIMLPAFSGMGA